MLPVWAVVQPLGPGTGHGGLSTAVEAMVRLAGVLLWQVGPYHDPWGPQSAEALQLIAGPPALVRLAGALSRAHGAAVGLTENLQIHQVPYIHNLLETSSSRVTRFYLIR